MARILEIMTILISASAVAHAQVAPSSVTLTWLGQSTFVMTTNTGLKALLDPSIKVEQAAHQITLVSGKLPAQRTIIVMKYE